MKNYFFTLFLLSNLFNIILTGGIVRRPNPFFRKTKTLSNVKLQKLQFKNPSIVLSNSQNLQRRTTQENNQNTPINNNPINNNPINNNPINNTPTNNTPINNTPMNNTPMGNNVIPNTPMVNTEIKNNSGKVHEVNVTGSCNDNLLKSFGINRSENRGPEVAKAFAKSFCRLNRTTCCTGIEINETAKVYAEAAYELKKKFEILEEITVLFQGEQYKELLFDVKSMDQCHSILESNNYFKDFKGMEDFLEVGIPDLVDKIHELTLDVQNYVKKNLWFYSNLVCTICSPLYAQFFNLENGQTTITANYSNCSEFIEMNEFEIRTVDIFQNVIKLFVDLAKCKNDWTNDADYAVDELNIDTMEKEKKDFYQCYESSDFTTANCRNICTKRQFDDYNFPIPIFKILGQSLKVLFEEFAGMDIEEFYRTIKGTEFSDFTKDGEIQFFKKNEYFLKFDLDKPVWDLKVNEGITIYNDHMGKKYFLVEKEFGRILSIFISTFVLLWI